MPIQPFLTFSGKILSVHRHDWPSCFSASCHDHSNAVIVIDSNSPGGHGENVVGHNSIQDMIHGGGEKEEDEFRPSYPTADIP